MGKTMTVEEFGEKVSGHYALVIDGVLTIDDAEDALVDILSGVIDEDYDEACDLRSWLFEKFFG